MFNAQKTGITSAIWLVRWGVPFFMLAAGIYGLSRVLPSNSATDRALGWAIVFASLVMLCILIVLDVTGRGRAQRATWGWAGVLLGADGRVSTSKVQVIMWTLGLAYALAYLAGVAAFLKPDVVFGADDNRWSDYLILLGGPFGAAVLAKFTVQSKLENGTIEKPLVPGFADERAIGQRAPTPITETTTTLDAVAKAAASNQAAVDAENAASVALDAAKALSSKAPDRAANALTAMGAAAASSTAAANARQTAFAANAAASLASTRAVNANAAITEACAATAEALATSEVATLAAVAMQSAASDALADQTNDAKIQAALDAATTAKTAAHKANVASEQASRKATAAIDAVNLSQESTGQGGNREPAKGLLTNDSGNLDIVDAQYVIFNLIAFAYVAVVFISVEFTANAPDKHQLPEIPAILLGLTGVAAATYVGNKAIQRSGPRISLVSADTTNPGRWDILGVNLVPAGISDVIAKPQTTLIFRTGGVDSVSSPLDVTSSRVTFALADPGTAEVAVVTAAGLSTNFCKIPGP